MAVNPAQSKKVQGPKANPTTSGPATSPQPIATPKPVNMCSAAKLLTSNNHGLPNMSRMDDSFEATYSANVSMPLANFDTKDRCQKLIANSLTALLKDIHFDDANRAASGDSYGIASLFDTNTVSLKAFLSNSNKLSERQKSAVLFLKFGFPLKGPEIDLVFGGQKALFKQLEAMNIIVPIKRGATVFYRLNNLSLTSYRLANGKEMYLFMDLPKGFSIDTQFEPTAQLGATSYILLKGLEKGFHEGKRYEGIAADFGSGVGIQSIAMLMLHPGISKMIALDIDERSMNLNRFNALMNGVESRIVIRNNLNPNNLKAALAGKKLAVAISNPPFNAVPHEYEAEFTSLGYGGDHGIDVTTIFLRQALPVLEKSGEFILYSVLAKDESGTPFISKYIQGNFPTNGLEVDYRNLNLVSYNLDRDTYARALAAYLDEQSNKGNHRLRLHGASEESKELKAATARIKRLLKGDEIASLTPTMIVIKNTGELTMPRFTSHMMALPIGLESYHAPKGQHEQKRGGIYSTVHSLPNKKGGMFLRNETSSPLLLKLGNLIKPPDKKK